MNESRLHALSELTSGTYQHTSANLFSLPRLAEGL